MIKLKDLLPEGIQDKGIFEVYSWWVDLVVKLMCLKNIWNT